ncbi:Promiscuous sugar phosphatase YidA, haloacid dehalogenase-like phosphatase family [Pediococcus damnosus]|uniref:sugar-phosphatase n=1 Tax=Pediococcus damnosus TaxID=51663 RepID=UPI00078C9667|nr:sugar-phosphatase [Pediococcus damnosus]AMV60195.1 Promiscuous sugar phosphatase YidA, haloacid dehalogenase-like phosphatase family [Pediococcus damnosus]AMV64440.1 Promiscuous sugar phosphatase YidA, haloacid dehalogenase-like phosphatase family [Pediococcus damnosus]
MIKLIAIDLDGTLLTDDKHIAAETVTAIKQASQSGVKVVLCSGRPLTGVAEHLHTLGLSGNDQYVITFNGALVQTIEGRVLIHHTLNYNDYTDLEALSRKLHNHFHVETENHIYTANKNISPYTIGESFYVRMAIRYRAVGDMPANFKISKGMFIDPPEKITELRKKIPQTFLDKYYFVQSEPYFLEVLNKSASKGNALKGLTKRLNLLPENVMTIGDQGNDLSMLQFAGTPVAMGNAIPEAKKLATFITSTNEENGVAKAIQKFVLD